MAVPSATSAPRDPISFDDVAVIFSGEEWDMLNSLQRALYMEVMKENYEHFISLGFKVPIILSWLQNGNKDAKTPKESPATPEPAANHVRQKRPIETPPAVQTYSGAKRGRKPKRPRLSGNEVKDNIENENKIQPENKSRSENKNENKVNYENKIENQNNIENNRDDSDGDDHSMLDPISHDDNYMDSTSPPHGRNLRKRRQFYCAQCEKCFNYSSALDAHMRVHSGDKPHKCEICDETFSFKSELIVHRRTHMNSSQGNENISPAPLPRLPEDPRAANKTPDLPTNTLGPKPNTENKTIPQMFNQTPRASVSGHVKSPASSASSSSSMAAPRSPLSTSSSPGPSSSTPLPLNDSDKPLKCNYCEKRFNDRSILEAHHRIHTGKLAYACNLCDESFSKPSLLAAHNNTHREGKPFQCDQCEKNFNDQSLLIAHKRTHTGEKPHKCTQCNKWFPNRNSLLEHEETHLKPKPFKCRHCDKSFNDKSLLLTHEGVHTDTKPFKCTQCNESFFLKTQLMAHQSTHAPEKPYPCNQCERSFNKKETLLAHIRVHNMQSAQVQKRFKK